MRVRVAVFTPVLVHRMLVVLVVRMRHRAVGVGVHVPDRRGGIVLVVRVRVRVRVLGKVAEAKGKAVRVRVRVRVPAPLRQRSALEPAHHADDDQRRPHDALSPLRDDLHVERQLIPEQHEDEAEENLARVVAQAPQRAHHRVCIREGPTARGVSAARIRARQRVKTSRQESRVAALDRHGRRHERGVATALVAHDATPARTVG